MRQLLRVEAVRSRPTKRKFFFFIFKCTSSFNKFNLQFQFKVFWTCVITIIVNYKHIIYLNLKKKSSVSFSIPKEFKEPRSFTCKSLVTAIHIHGYSCNYYRKTSESSDHISQEDTPCWGGKDIWYSCGNHIHSNFLYRY